MLVTRETSSAGTVLQRSFAGWARAAERKSPLLAILLIVFIFFYGVIKAFSAPLWLDEVMGILIAKLPSTSAIWEICKAGADNQPIFFHYLVRASIHLLGTDELGVRFPALAGYMLFCWSLYCFVSRLSSGLYGLAAILFASLSGSWFYATDGRPYGLVLGFTGAAAVSWQAIGSSRHRAVVIAGLALSLTLLFNMHYYAPLVLGPFGLAEIVRSNRARKFDWAVWLAFFLPLLALIPYIPLVREARLNSGITGDYLSSPELYGSLRLLETELLEPCLVTLISMACVFLMYQGFFAPQRSAIEHVVSSDVEARKSREQGLIPDLVLIVGLAASPILVVVFSLLVTHVFFTRYAVISVFGLDALVCMCLWFAFSGREVPGLITVVAFFCALAFTDVQGWLFQPPRAVRLAMQHLIPAEASRNNLPIAVEDPHAFMQLHYYTDRDIQQKLFYLTDEQYALHVMNSTFLERMMVGSAPYFGTQVVAYKQFVASHSDFYVLGGLEWWLGRRLLEDKGQITLLQGGLLDNKGTHAEVLLRVHMPLASQDIHSQ